MNENAGRDSHNNSCKLHSMNWQLSDFSLAFRNPLGN